MAAQHGMPPDPTAGPPSDPDRPVYGGWTPPTEAGPPHQAGPPNPVGSPHETGPPNPVGPPHETGPPNPVGPPYQAGPPNPDGPPTQAGAAQQPAQAGPAGAPPVCPFLWAQPGSPQFPGAPPAAPGDPTFPGTPPTYGTQPSYGTQPTGTGPTGGLAAYGLGSGRRRRFRKRHGFLALVGILVVVLLIQVLISPWAFHIGGSPTLTGHWVGQAEGAAPDGSRYAMQIDLQAYFADHHGCDSNGCSDFHGKVTICTKAGRFQFPDMDGTVGGWTSVDGQKTTIDFGEGYLHGVWHGKVLQINDGGYLERDFTASGAKATTVTSPDPTHAVVLNVQSGGSFDAMCTAVKG